MTWKQLEDFAVRLWIFSIAFCAFLVVLSLTVFAAAAAWSFASEVLRSVA